MEIDLEVAGTRYFQKAVPRNEKAEGATRQPLRFFAASSRRGT
jgi:hypothetical protein